MYKRLDDNLQETEYLVTNSMVCKFTQLDESDNEPILINPSWIACIEKNEDEGCSVRLGISSDGGTANLKYVIESYETIKNMLC